MPVPLPDVLNFRPADTVAMKGLTHDGREVPKGDPEAQYEFNPRTKEGRAFQARLQKQPARELKLNVLPPVEPGTGLGKFITPPKPVRRTAAA